MAVIDKTYTNSFKEYKEFKDWADKQKLTFFDGLSVCIGDYVWKLDEEDFDNGEIPIMNTPTWLDVYLIQNCKSEFVLNRMKEVYSEKFHRDCKTIDLSAKPSSDFQQNRKITIRPDKQCKFPFKKRMFNKPINGGKWWLQCDDRFWYNSETKRWVSWDAYYPHDTNTAHISSTKALIRHLRKQYLPKGITFIISGRYIGEEYIVIIH